MTMTKTCGLVGVGLGVSVGVGEGLGDSLGEGDGVVVATGGDAHDIARATTSMSAKRDRRIDGTIVGCERVGAHGVREHVGSVRARTPERSPRP